MLLQEFSPFVRHRVFTAVRGKKSHLDVQPSLQEWVL